MRSIFRLSILFPIGIVALGITLVLLGFRFNTSDSIARGLYRLHHGAMDKNSYVLFCPDDRESFKAGIQRGYLGVGFCPNRSGYLMKKVVAVTGDVISSDQQGVRVNGRLLPFSKPIKQDGMGRNLKAWEVQHYTLKTNELLTMTDQDPLSFDGRYYGIINRGLIKGVITPVWVHKLKVVT